VIPRTDKPVHDIRNHEEVRRLLRAHVDEHGGEVIETTLDVMAWHEQMAAAAQTDVWLAVRFRCGCARAVAASGGRGR